MSNASKSLPILPSAAALLILLIGGALWFQRTPQPVLEDSEVSTEKMAKARKRGKNKQVSTVSTAAVAPVEPVSPVVLVGVDGFEWSVVLPLLAEGKLPNIAKLLEDGVGGEVDTISPTGSPIIWTTIATGMGRKQHGIMGFRKPKGGGLYTSTDRKKKAFWNILSDYDRRVAVIGWWVSYPAEPVNGVVVAQMNTRMAGVETDENIVKGGIFEGVAGQVTPLERQEEILTLVPEVEASLPALHQQVFGDSVTQSQGPLPDRLWEASQWSIRADTIYHATAKTLLQSETWDLLAVYYGGPDVLGHRYWRYMQPESFETPPTEAEVAALGNYIPAYYERVDTMIGEIRALAAPDTTFIVISDHGMVASNTDSKFHDHAGHRQIISGAHGQAPPSFFTMSGPHIRGGQFIPTADTTRDQVPSLGSVFDLTPTLLTLLGVPVGADMQGKAYIKPLKAKVKEKLLTESVGTHTPSDWAETRQLGDAGARDETERLEQLRELGYIE